jgi:hypothetical protein
MTFPADGIDLVFFGVEQLASVHCFDCCLGYGVMVNPKSHPIFMQVHF